MRAFVEDGNPGAVGLAAVALAAIGVLTFGWGSYLALAGAAGLMLVAARASQEHLPFPRRRDAADAWRIDARTRAAARRGLADARAALDGCQQRRKPRGAHTLRGGQR
jgi:hypothetical protein